MSNLSPARYLEIADYLRSLVASGEVGDRLPSDAELCQQFGVSRMTARQGTQLLVNDRLVLRKQGQGTFVAPRPVPRLLGSPLSFTEGMRRRGLRPSSRVLYRGVDEPTVEEAKALRLLPGQHLVRLERLRLADDVPMAIERAVITPSCAAATEADLERGSLHDAFERLGRLPVRSEAQVTARRATGREIQLLELSADGVVMCERHTIYDHYGVPLEHTETCYAANRYVFKAVLHRGDTDTAE